MLYYKINEQPVFFSIPYKLYSEQVQPGVFKQFQCVMETTKAITESNLKNPMHAKSSCHSTAFKPASKFARSI
jgi:hypothetical protein